MEKNEAICAVDVGSTFIKATLRCGVDNIVTRASIPSPKNAIDDDPSGHDALWSAFTTVVREVCAKQKPTALIVSSQMAGLSMIDDHGRPIGALIPGVDMRFPSQHTVDVSASGCGDSRVSTVSKLLWFAETHPDFNVSKARIGGIKEFLLQRLTGRWATDPASASSTGFYSIAEQNWSAETLKMTGISASQLPDMEEMGSVVGSVLASAAEDCEIRVGTPVLCGLGDGPAANISSGAVGPKILCLSRGTTVVARILWSGEIPHLGSLPYFLQHVHQTWKCVGVRLTVDPATGFFMPPGNSTRPIRPEDIGEYLQPLLDAFGVREVRPAGRRHIPLPAHWLVSEVPADAQDGTRGMTLIATGWKLEDGDTLRDSSPAIPQISRKTEGLRDRL